MKNDFINLTEENVSDEHLCCIIPVSYTHLAFVVGTSSIIRSLDTFEEMYNAYVQELEK